ncbi:hypothetical protein EVAR_87093_1 [Eumeta japonica]|uniref:Uncharacterized protein n=1 Tax=Eumeta variegata TaxID=151549 RepID=A0A4C1VQK2_EUMVA|nr:hypothetical protein EVAR_87093_1 [Eumeta japonica]
MSLRDGQDQKTNLTLARGMESLTNVYMCKCSSHEPLSNRAHVTASPAPPITRNVEPDITRTERNEYCLYVFIMAAHCAVISTCINVRETADGALSRPLRARGGGLSHCHATDL